MTNRRTGEFSFQHGRTATLRDAHFDQRPTPVYDPARGFPLLQRPDATIEAFGVQAWSQGALYPCVIAVIERYDDQPSDDTGREHLLAYRLRSRSYELTLDGHSEEYASYADAAHVARALLASPDERAKWSQTGAPCGCYPEGNSGDCPAPGCTGRMGYNREAGFHG